MSVLASDIYLYGSNSMPDNVQTATGTVGGAIDKTKRVEFQDLSGNDTINVVADGTQTNSITIEGRDTGGLGKIDEMIASHQGLARKVASGETLTVIEEAMLERVGNSPAFRDLVARHSTKEENGED